MTYTNVSVSNYDVLALEIKLEKDFNNSNGSYYDGEYDGKLGFEPSQENWLSAYNNKIFILFNIEKTTTTLPFYVVR